MASASGIHDEMKKEFEPYATPKANSPTLGTDTNFEEVRDKVGKFTDDEGLQTAQDDGSGTPTLAQICDDDVESEGHAAWEAKSKEDIDEIAADEDKNMENDTMLFTWKGFLEKLAAVRRAFTNACITEVDKSPTPTPPGSPLEETASSKMPVIFIESDESQQSLTEDEDDETSYREEENLEMQLAPEKDKPLSVNFETDEDEITDDENEKIIGDGDGENTIVEVINVEEEMPFAVLDKSLASEEPDDTVKRDDGEPITQEEIEEKAEKEPIVVANEAAIAEREEAEKEETEEDPKEENEEDTKEEIEEDTKEEIENEAKEKTEEETKEPSAEEAVTETEKEKTGGAVEGNAPALFVETAVLSFEKVDPKISKRFKRRIREHAKNVIKSQSVPDVTKRKDVNVIIAPTVRRLDEDSDKIKSEKTNISESDQSINSGKEIAAGRPSVRVVAVVGEEGHGKTTLLNRFAEKALGRLLVVNEVHEFGLRRWHPFARKDFFKFVHIFNYRDLPAEGQFTPCQLLLKDTVGGLDDQEANEGCQWLVQYKKSAVFIVDDVDVAEVFLHQSHKPLGYHEKGSASCVLYNLLTGTIFPYAFVLFSSSTTNHQPLLDGFFKPNRIYKLQSFERIEVRSYFEKNVSTWKKLNEKFPNLLAKCEVPINCIYTSVALHRDNFTRDSLIGAMAQYIKFSICGEKSWSQENLTTLTKLTELAFRAKNEGKVILADENFTDVGMSLDEAQTTSLFTAKSATTPPSENGEKKLCVCRFSHSTIQDFLAILHLCESNVPDFLDFISEHLDEPAFHFLKAQLFAALLDQKSLHCMRNMVKASYVEEKQVMLMQHLRNNMLSHEFAQDQMRFYTLLHDCKEGIDHILKGNLRSMSVTGEKLTFADIYILASLAVTVGNIDILKLDNCGITDEVLLRLLKQLQGVSNEVKIRAICIRGNAGIRFFGPSLRDLIRFCKSEELDVSNCDMHVDALASLLRTLKDTNLKRLVVGENPGFGETSMQALGDFVRKNEVKALGINKCAMNEAKLRKLRKSLKNAQLEALDVSGNKEMGVQGSAILGMIVHENGVQELNLSECGLTKEKIRNFSASLGTSKVKILDISIADLRTASKFDVTTVAILFLHVTEELKMTNWMITGESLTLIEEGLNKLPVTALKISYGPNGENVIVQAAKEN